MIITYFVLLENCAILHVCSKQIILSKKIKYQQGSYLVANLIKITDRSINGYKT